MDKRYQVFVSSTFQDLEDERQEVMHALLELDCIPSGMELFPAANEDQWNLIKRVIDDCDYYVLIIGGRYGTIGPEGLSYTEMEYRYAESIRKPTIAFVHKDPGQIISSKTESDESRRAKLEAFRKHVARKLWKNWSNAHELGSVVSRSLVQLIKTTPAIGWVRANELASKQATEEILQLRNDNDELRRQLNKISVGEPQGVEHLASGDELFLLRCEVMATSGTKMQSFAGTVRISWDTLFSTIGPLLLQPTSKDSIEYCLCDLVTDGFSNQIEFENSLAVQSNIINFSGMKVLVNSDDVGRILLQFRALGYICSSIDKVDNYRFPVWCLTAYGDNLVCQLLAIKRGNSH